MDALSKVLSIFLIYFLKIGERKYKVIHVMSITEEGNKV